MGQTYTNQIVKGAGFHYAGNQPLDDRLVVDTYDDLATLDANYSSYEGMPVYVKSVSDLFIKTASGWVIASGSEDNDIPIVSLRFPSYTDTQILTNLYQRTFVLVRAETEFFGQTIRAVINGQSFTVTFPGGSQAERVQLSGDLSSAYLKTSKNLTSNGTFYKLELVQESTKPFDATTLVISTVKVYAPTVQASNVSLPVQDYVKSYTDTFLEQRKFHTVLTMSYDSATSTFTGLLENCYSGSEDYMVFGLVTRSNNMSIRYSFSGLWNSGTTVIYPLDADAYIRFIDANNGDVRIRIDGTAGGASTVLVSVYFIKI